MFYGKGKLELVKLQDHKNLDKAKFRMELLKELPFGGLQKGNNLH